MKEKYLIGQVAKIMNISRDTLRYYDKLGIVCPRKDPDTSYRYYTLEDLFSLSYVLTFRDLDIPLETIQNLMKNNRLQDFNELLTQQATIVDTRIDKLLVLKERVLAYQAHIKTAERLLGRIEHVYNPPIVFHPLQEEWDAGFADLLSEMEAHPAISAPSPTVLLDANFVKDKAKRQPISYGINGTLTDLNALKSLSRYTFFHPRPCLHTVVQVEDDPNDETILCLQDYLKTHKLEIADDILSGCIAFEHIDKVPIEYYELWIPINYY